MNQIFHDLISGLFILGTLTLFFTVVRLAWHSSSVIMGALV